MKTGIRNFIVKNHYLVTAVLCFLVGGVLALMCLIQKVPLLYNYRSHVLLLPETGYREIIQGVL